MGMEKKDNFENIKLPYVRNVKPTLLRDEIEGVSRTQKNIIKIRRKMNDNVYRYNGKWSNEMIHGNKKEK
jgi:hypothetical protein